MAYKNNFKLIHDQSPELPFKSPFPGGFRSGDKLRLSVEMEPESCLLITLKSSDADNGLQNPFSLSLTLNGDQLQCNWGENKMWEQDHGSKTIENGIINMSLWVFNEKYYVCFDGDSDSTFTREYPLFESDTLEIGLTKGVAVVELISVTRKIQWSCRQIGSPIPDWALKCGIDEDGNVIFLGCCFTDSNNPMKVVSVIPAKNTAITAFNGVEHQLESYQLLVNNSRYVWTFIGVYMKIPEYAIAIKRHSNDDDEVYVGRFRYKGAIIPGTIDKRSKILSIPFGGEEVKISSRYQVLVALPPLTNEALEVTVP